jgi:predicted nucleic acid-binding protein
MSDILVDSNVLLDLLQEDSAWSEWSAKAVREAVDSSNLVINPLIYAEVSISFRSPEELNQRFPGTIYRREDLPWEADFQAGQCFVKYRRGGGARTSPLPDFYIGAHAQVRGYRLLTRDTGRYRTYFPAVELICPNTV